MAIDLDAIRNRLNQLKTTTKKQNNLWRPADGKQTIRIVPYQHDKSNPFQELLFHYNLGKRNFLSPQTYGKPDPVVEFSEKLQQTGDKEDWKLGKQMEPKMRTYVPIVVRGQEAEGVKFWGFGKTVYQELMGIITDPDYGDITDPMNGRDIVVEFTPASGPGSFPKTSIRPKPNTSQVTETKEIAEKITTEQPDLKTIFKEPTYDELKTALDGWLNPTDGDEEMDAASTNSETQQPIDEGTSSAEVGTAFAALFDDKK